MRSGSNASKNEKRSATRERSSLHTNISTSKGIQTRLIEYKETMVADEERDKRRCMVRGWLCYYHAWDCNNPIFLCKGAGDCLCIRHSCCVAVNSPQKGCGMTTDKGRNECCKIGCFCCDLGLVWPRVLCGCASQVCCCYDVASFPCDDEFMPGPVCTICCPFLQVCPKCGCCIAPPPCPALDKVLNDQPLLMEMDREAIPPCPTSPTTTTTTVRPDGTTETISRVVNPDGSTTVTKTVISAQNDVADDVAPPEAAVVFIPEAAVVFIPEADVEFIPPPTALYYGPVPSAPPESMVKHC